MRYTSGIRAMMTTEIKFVLIASVFRYENFWLCSDHGFVEVLSEQSMTGKPNNKFTLFTISFPLSFLFHVQVPPQTLDPNAALEIIQRRKHCFRMLSSFCKPFYFVYRFGESKEVLMNSSLQLLQVS